MSAFLTLAHFFNIDLHAAFCTLHEYVIIYTARDHIDQTSAHHCLVTPPLPPLSPI